MSQQVLLCGGNAGSGGGPFTADFPSTLASTGTGTSAAGNTTAAQVGAPSYGNGSGSYSWSWARVSGSTALVCSSSTVERPTFYAYASNGTPEVAVWRCTTTDSGNSNTATSDVTITCTYTQVPAVVSIAGGFTIEDIEFDPWPPTAYTQLQFNSNGYVYKRTTLNGTQTQLEQWLVSGDPNGVSAYVTATGDALTSGTLNSYVNLSGSNDWVLSNPETTTVPSTLETVLTVKLYDNGTMTLLDQATYTLRATNDAA